MKLLICSSSLTLVYEMKLNCIPLKSIMLIKFTTVYIQDK